MVVETHGSVDRWFAEVRATLGADHLASTPIVAIDVTSGAVVGSTAAADLLVDGPLRQVRDLTARGAVAAPDVERLRHRVQTWEVPRHPTEEQARTFTDQLRIHGPQGPQVAHLSITQHRRPRVGGELLLITLERADPLGPLPMDRTNGPDVLAGLMDRETRILAADPGFRVLWADPQAVVGTLASVLTHPEDLAEVLPVAHLLYSGRLDRVAYTVRLAADDGRWVPIHVEARRMLTADDFLIGTTNRVVDRSRRLIPPGLLSQRETSVVAALFDGRRVTQIAEDDGVSVHTVRNQLKSIYRKLDTSGQADLLSLYHRPATTP